MKAHVLAAKEAAVVAAQEAEEKPSSTGDWKVLEDIGLYPESILCQEYWQVESAVVSCHSNLQLTADAMINHLNAEHGGCYFIKTDFTDGRPWPGWAELSSKSIRLLDFRCDVCEQPIPLNTQSIIKHIRPHKDGNLRIREGGVIRIQIA